MEKPSDAQLEQEVNSTNAQRKAAEAQNRNFQLIAQNLQIVAEREADTKRLKSEIIQKLPDAKFDTPGDIQTLVTKTNSLREEAQARNREFQLAAQNLQIIAQCEASDDKLRAEIERLQKLYPPKS